MKIQAATLMSIAALSGINSSSAQEPPPVDRIAATPSPTLAIALEAAQIARDTCKIYKVSVAVVDSVGDLKVMLASDGAPPLATELAWRKARTSAIFKMPSSQSKTDRSLAYRLSSSLYSYYGGGLPLIAHGIVIGAIAVSGGENEQGDEVCSRAAVEKVASRLT
jgi:uncharacterized protein GlcG (DUF336 family)